MDHQMSRRAFLGASAVTLSAATSGLTPALAQQKTTLSVRIDRDIASLDPAFRGGAHDANVIRAVFQRLAALKVDGSGVELDAASELKQVSPTLVEFTLKPGQMFTEGYGEMTAEDVKFSFERYAVAPVEGKVSPYKSDWTGLAEVEVTGTYTGRIKLSVPNAGLMFVAIGDSSGCIVSKKAVLERGAGYAVKPVGSGAYMVASVEKQRGAVLKRNPDYKGPKPAFEEIRVNFIQDPKTAELALRAGELDFAVLPPSIAEAVRGAQGVNVQNFPGLADVWLGINMEKAPFTDLRVRQAVRLALDVDQMLLAGYNGKAPRLNAVVMPPVIGAWKDAPVYKRNVAEAKKLLADAGQTAIKTRITVLNQPAFQSMALVAQALLQEVGITAEVDAREGGTFWDTGKGEAGKNVDMFIMRFNGKLDPSFLMQWFTTSQVGIWNWQRFKSEEFDKLQAAGIGEIDPVKRAELVVKAQQEMDKSGAFVWLTNDITYVVSRSSIKPAFLPGAIDWDLQQFTLA